MNIKDYPGISWFYDDERQALVDLIPKNGTFLEIGTWTGTTAAWLADRRPDINIVCVDTFGGPSCGNQATTNETILTWFKNRRPNMYLWVGELRTFPSGLIYDVILIDGDHSAEAVYADFRESYCRLAINGFILAHDYYSDEHPGVKAGINKAMALATYPGRIIKRRWTTMIQIVKE